MKGAAWSAGSEQMKIGRGGGRGGQGNDGVGVGRPLLSLTSASSVFWWGQPHKTLGSFADMVEQGSQMVGRGEW